MYSDLNNTSNKIHQFFSYPDFINNPATSTPRVWKLKLVGKSFYSDGYFSYFTSFGFDL